jgi:hypothetical protein
LSFILGVCGPLRVAPGDPRADKWDYWAWIDLPIDEVRRRMNILPKA